VKYGDTYKHSRGSHLSTSQPELGKANCVGEEDSSDCHHGPAAINEFTLTVPRQRVLIGAQAQRIKTPVASCMQSGITTSD
jgi:hypothetical protein